MTIDQAEVKRLELEYRQILDQGCKDIEEVYEKYVDDLTEEYKEATLQMVVKAFVVGALIGCFFGVVVASIIQSVMS